MKKIFLIPALLLTGFLLINATLPGGLQKKDYDKQWTEVKKLREKGLPKSALEIVRQIYSRARKEQNKPEILKSLIYTVALKSSFEEDYLLKSINFFKRELKESETPETQILHSLLAELYQNYYNNNRYKILDRNIEENPPENDMQLWDAKHFHDVIKQHYLMSVENSGLLKKIPLRNYGTIIIPDSSVVYLNTPTLYDLLAQRAIRYFSSPDASTFDFTKSLPDTSFLVPVGKFVHMDISNEIGESKKTILKLFRELTILHSDNHNDRALVRIDMQRLDWVKDHIFPVNEAVNRYYISALDQLQKTVHDPEAIARVAYRKASYLYQLAKNNEYARKESVTNRYQQAETICNEALRKFPESSLSENFRDLIKKIHAKSLSLKMEDALPPGKPILFRCSYRNTDTLYLKVVAADFKLNFDSWEQRDKKIKQWSRQKGVFQKKYWLPFSKDLRMHSAEMELPGLPSGYYIVFLSDDPQFGNDNTVVYNDFQVTDMAYLIKPSPKTDSLNFYAVRRENGKPLSGVKVTLYRQNYNPRMRVNRLAELGNYITDKNGFVTLFADRNQPGSRYLFKLEKDDDRFYDFQNFWFGSYGYNDKPVTIMKFFTDRAVYRPGQIVYFKAILINRLKNDFKTVNSEKVTVYLLDANYKKVASLELRTNEYGSVSGSFILPTDRLNGLFTLKSKYGTRSFRVEEYKRPHFKVEIDTLDKKYRLNERVTVSGKAGDYAGSPLTDAKVVYRVTRQPLRMWRYFYFYRPFPQMEKEVEIANGELVTDNEGRFKIGFKAIPDPAKNSNNFTFTLYVDVTDITGETHSASMTMNIGKDPFVLTIEGGETVLREKSKGITVSAENLAGKEVETDVEILLYKLSPPRQVFVSRGWSLPDTILIPKSKFTEDFPHLPFGNENETDGRPKKLIRSKKFRLHGKSAIFENELKTLEPGEYLIEAVSRIENDREIKTRKKITLFSLKSKTVPVKQPLWLQTDRQQIEPGDKLTVIVGSGEKKTNVLLEIYANDKLLKNQWLVLGKKPAKIEIPVTEEYRGMLMIKATGVRYNRAFKEMKPVEVPFSNKKLQIRLETRRDFLTPGKKEEWRVNITGNKGEKVSAEVLTAMYDASLDTYASNSWQFNLFRPVKPAITWKPEGFGIVSGTVLFSPAVSRHPFPQPVYPRINWFGFNGIYGFRGMRFSEMEMEVQPGAFFKSEQLKTEATFNIVEEQKSRPPEMPYFDGEKKLTQNNNTSGNPGIEPEYRSDFRETAFFYPQLYTDSMGTVSFSFTTPDALTEWKWMLLAHTSDLKTGIKIFNLKARKDLMIIPNKPRFVRTGDTLDFSSKLINFTGKEIKVKVIHAFFNPENGTPVNVFRSKSTVQEKITVPAGKSISVVTRIVIPEGLEMLGFRIKAESSRFTDGVEDILPVLPNKILITETMPMTVKGKKSRTFRFDKLTDMGKTMQAEGIEPYRYTVEFTSHPVWYAVQALPVLAKPQYESAENIFNRFYANTIAGGIVSRYPRIKKVLELWKEQTPDAFLSNLRKNEALKNVLLDATPWVLEAENETEQKRRIALLFDMNNLSNDMNQSLKKLARMQHPSGAWPWFKGMYDDRFVTQSIVSGFARLRKMGFYKPVSGDKTFKMLKKAVQYLDNRISKDYNDLKKIKNINLKKEHLGSLQIQYLYARTAFLDLFPVADKNRKAFDYYASQARRYWLRQNNYLQAMIAVILERLNQRNEAEGIVRSLTERALESDENGMYWRTERGWYWYQAPVEAEVMILEAYDEVMHDRVSVEKMKLWLLKNKQTNRWPTSRATADAVFGLLMRGDNLLEETGDVALTVGDETLNDRQKEAGTGFLQKSWKQGEIKPELGVVKVTNPNRSMAWGAAFFQYFESIGRVKSKQTGLKIEKQYFVEQLTGTGPQTVALQPQTVLRPGQKVVVRLVIRSDRDLQYVHLKDLRAPAFEPVQNISGTQMKEGLIFYENIKDASVDFFIRHLPKGTHVLEYDLRVNQRGTFSGGIATVQSLYAPEFAAHSQGGYIKVK